MCVHTFPSRLAFLILLFLPLLSSPLPAGRGSGQGAACISLLRHGRGRVLRQGGGAEDAASGHGSRGSRQGQAGPDPAGERGAPAGEISWNHNGGRGGRRKINRTRERVTLTIFVFASPNTGTGGLGSSPAGRGSTDRAALGGRGQGFAGAAFGGGHGRGLDHSAGVHQGRWKGRAVGSSSSAVVTLQIHLSGFRPPSPYSLYINADGASSGESLGADDCGGQVE